MIQKMSIDQLLPLCKEKDQRAQLEVYQRYHLAMYHSALRSIRLKGMPAIDAEASLAGSGSIYLSCSENLDAKVAGSGRIRYFGEPSGKIHTKVAGSGSIRLATE
jgi:hypothetical protein